MTLWGYAVILGYIFFLIFAAGPLVQKYTNTETSRKTIHTMLFAVWCLIDVFFKGTVHQVLIPVFFIVMNLLSYRFGIYKSIERQDSNHLGTVYFALAVTFVMTVSWFYPAFYYPSGIAVFCLTFGDGFAALMGYNLKSRKIFHGKSLAGFLSCFAATALSLLVFSLVYPAEMSLLSTLMIAGLTAILELTDRGLDNFTIVLGTFFVSHQVLSGAPDAFVFSFLTGIAVFGVVFFSGAIDYYGSLLALGMVFSFSFFGGIFGLCYLLATYFVIFFVSLFKRRILRREKKGSGRGFLQILINGGLGTAFMLLYGIAGLSWALPVSIVAIGGCFVDSLSSDIGVLSKQLPYDPFRRKQVPAGISGGMTLLGTGAALAGALGIPLISAPALGLSAADGVFMGMLIFGQSLLDTALGSLIQVKYTCSVCAGITEQKIHCGQPTGRTGGLSWVDNNMVNLLSSLIITAIAVPVFWR